MNLTEKHEALTKNLRALHRVVVAYSGGVDSTFLLKAAVDTLGADNVLACMSVGPSEPSHLLEKAGSVARPRAPATGRPAPERRDGACA